MFAPPWPTGWATLWATHPDPSAVRVGGVNRHDAKSPANTVGYAVRPRRLPYRLAAR